ncbi:MAG TPA: lantibiotic dehydratase [Actinomycetota bacterium]|nr:lantibiotic dehydratase [Actinomycetota bacterium]
MSKRRSLGAHAQGTFVLRSPLLSFDELEALSAELEAKATAADIDAAMERDFQRTRRRLRNAFTRPEVREALFLASPKLEARLDAWLEEANAGPPTKYEQALLRYFSRMSSRPTPFGLFAGVATGRLGTATVIEIDEISKHRRRTRPDMHFLTGLAEAVEGSPEFAPSLLLRPNSSLYRAGGRLRFAAHSMRNQRRSYRLIALDETPAVASILDRAHGGARLDELAASLVDEEITIDDAVAFVTRLVTEQILVGEIGPPLTGEDPVRTMISGLYSIPGAEPIAEVIERCRLELEKFDTEGLGVEPTRYRELATQLDQAPVDVEISRLFQTDLVLSARTATLGTDVVEGISEGLWALKALMSRPRSDALGNWRTAFAERYGEREVPLTLALDEELGIGFEMSRAPAAEASPLLKGLPFPADEPAAPAMSPRGGLLLRKLHRALADGARSIVLTDDDVEALRGERPVSLPDAFGALAVIARRSDGTARVLLQGAAGPPGAKLLARFCHVDEEVALLVADHLRDEQGLRPDALFAEIVHLPEGRTGNVLSRPVLRTHEIAYLGRSGAPEDSQLALDDLFVSVSGDHIRLRSKRLDREVLPRLTSAHNYTLSGLGVYRFLCELQAQGVADGIVWSWGAFDRAPFLPRIEYRRATLTRARWMLDREQLAGVISAPTVTARYENMQDLRDDLSIPRWVALQDEDNELVVDLVNAFSLETLLQLVKDRPFLRLVELWPEPSDLVVSGPTGRHACEVVVPFIRDAEPRASGRAHGRAAGRSFVPGSEWLFAKIFTGSATSDLVLREVMAPLVESFVASGTVTRWFFVRYSDPHWHLRLRMNGEPAALMNEVLPALTALVEREIEKGRVWRFQLDTYEREVDRYGGPGGIEAAEDVFHADSDAAIEVLRAAPGDEGMEARWRLALVGVDRLFEDFGLDLGSKRRLARRQREAYALEFGAGTELKKRIGARFREEKAALAKEMAGGFGDRMPSESRAILDRRSRSFEGSIGAIKDLQAHGGLTVRLDELAATFAHMWVNRVLRSAHRAQEYVIYDFLDRLYAGLEAVQRQGRRP